MASWIVHLRVADILLDKYTCLYPKDFIMGNIAPDSGVPNDDWSAFEPSYEISHFRTGQNSDNRFLCAERFKDRYLPKNNLSMLDSRRFSFYLGYYDHLLTDALWSQKIANPMKSVFREEFENDPDVWNKWKKDWYDLDFLFLKKNPDFRAYRIFENTVGYKNRFLEFFPEDAFENRKKYIIGFYNGPRADIVRKYEYLTETQMENFTLSASEEIHNFNLVLTKSHLGGTYL